jgi:hypothetical protein
LPGRLACRPLAQAKLLEAALDSVLELVTRLGEPSGAKPSVRLR